ncbi:MAG TPA: limonene-1,2-epoxide hydrolase family protein [Mycobacteriales bacterium]|jgi:limonene-1,2-epoxide hydrolase|nr:limonene-1,2-epoxide hydrolase family protein [Mycobacteriales bacterium]HVX69793.1 limonene-1,2-epoxide hydrolase family protein [Mycobacteriales bacterium]
MTEPAESLAPAAERSPAETVTAFLHALADGDAETVLGLISDDLVYENVSLPTIRGRERFSKGLHDFNRRGVTFAVQIHRIAESGNTVMTERTDGLGYRRFYQQFWVCGVFEVNGGVITLWRDYFDWRDIAVSGLRGLAALAVPSLRATMPGS